MSERERFMARLAKAREAGLVDLKFFFHPAKALSPEEIFGAMNEIETAVESGRCVKHSAWKGNSAHA